MKEGSYELPFIYGFTHLMSQSLLPVLLILKTHCRFAKFDDNFMNSICSYQSLRLR